MCGNGEEWWEMVGIVPGQVCGINTGNAEGVGR